jgi:hypothetical protein
MKFLAKNLNTNSELSSNFLDIEKATNTKFFEQQINDISVFERNEALIINAIPEEVVPLTVVDQYRRNIREDITTQNQMVAQQKEEFNIDTQKKQITLQEKEEIKPLILSNNYTPLILLSVAGIAAVYLFSKKKNN